MTAEICFSHDIESMHGETPFIKMDKQLHCNG